LKRQAENHPRDIYPLRSSQYLNCLNSSFGYYFDRIFAGKETGGECYRVLFKQLGDLRFESDRGRGA
jgi:hypothetical protein